MKVVLATKNPGKLKELKELAQSAIWLELELAPEEFDPEETGTTFCENASLKAKIASQMSGAFAVADDSGLVVDALNGAPGIYSARYCAGSDADRRHKLMAALQEFRQDAERSARFVCCMALSDPSGKILKTTEGVWNGRIAQQEKGNNGFGYDPIFFIPDMRLTAAELSSDQKNSRSHRGKAWQAMVSYLNSIK